ncbi:PTS system mannose/fructose/N-acetylgalactosamine-transporter subunit IIB [Amedibacillus sp. YH-ame6]
MADIKLIRIDFRLIHGQVVTKWVKEANANRIVIVNDALAKDDFLGSVYKMAAPSNVKVDIYTVQEMATSWKENQLGEGNVLLLFKGVSDCRALQKLNFPMSQIQIGGLGGGAGRVGTSSGISFDAYDVSLIKEMCAEDKHVYIHVVPTQQKIEIEKVIEKLQFDN